MGAGPHGGHLSALRCCLGTAVSLSFGRFLYAWTKVTLYAMGILTTRLIGHKMIFPADDAAGLQSLSNAPKTRCIHCVGKRWEENMWNFVSMQTPASQWRPHA